MLGQSSASLPMGGMTAGMGQYPVPQQYHAAIRANYRFFVLRFPYFTESDQRVMGPYDLRCKEEPVPGQVRGRFDIRWLTGNSAGMTYWLVPSMDGVAVAYMVDDVFYHNRIVLMEQPWMLLGAEGMLTGGGTMPGEMLRNEISCLREIICEERPIFKIMRPNNTEVTFKFSKKEAEDLMKSERTRGVTLGRGATMPHSYQPYKDCHIVEGTIVAKKPEYEDMVKKYSKMPYGWTSVEGFRDVIHGKVQELLRERTGTKPQQTLPGFDMESLYQQFRSRFQSEMAAGSINMKEPPKANPALPPEPPMPAAAQTATQDAEIYTKSRLRVMNKESLLKVAAQKGISISENATNDQLAEAIMQKQDEGAPAIA